MISSRPEDAPDNAAKLVKSGQPLDFIFFDLPGTINNASIVNTIATMDYIFCPIAADRVVMESSIRFASIIHEHMISTGKTNVKGLYMLWNMVDGREKTELYGMYERYARNGTSRHEDIPAGQQAFPQRSSNGTKAGIPLDHFSC